MCVSDEVNSTKWCPLDLGGTLTNSTPSRCLAVLVQRVVYVTLDHVVATAVPEHGYCGRKHQLIM